MRTVDIGIRHDDYLVVSELCLIELVTDTCAQSHYYRLKLLIGINLVDSCLLNVEHLTPERENSLILTFSALLSRSACGVTLYDEDLTELCLIALAVSKLTGQCVILKYCLSSCKFSCSFSYTALSTIGLISALPSLLFVCPSN